MVDSIPIANPLPPKFYIRHLAQNHLQQQGPLNRRFIWFWPFWIHKGVNNKADDTNVIWEGNKLWCIYIHLFKMEKM